MVITKRRELAKGAVWRKHKKEALWPDNMPHVNGEMSNVFNYQYFANLEQIKAIRV